MFSKNKSVSLLQIYFVQVCLKKNVDFSFAAGVIHSHWGISSDAVVWLVSPENAPLVFVDCFRRFIKQQQYWI